jgi:hypothetical protein
LNPTTGLANAPLRLISELYDTAAATISCVVEAGQKVAIQRDSFGEVVAGYTSGVAGEITGQRSDAMSEPGNPLVFILFNKPGSGDVQVYAE